MSQPRATRAEIAFEQAHVDQVYQRLGELRSHAQSLRTKGYAMGHGAQNEAVFEQASMLFERDMIVSHANQTLHSLDAEYEGLVFGRLDSHDGETIHVGRLGVRDEEFNNLVTDWRAEAAVPFYQATAEEPMNIVRRRVIQCSGETVIDIDDDALIPHAVPQGMRVIGDGALMTALTEARGERMRDIVTTIQREQDEIIRAPWHGVTQITGGPGTGKTAVALHRIAYLLYRNRKQVGGGGVLVVGPSEAFTRYISRVLPSVGESSVELRALGDLLDGYSASHNDPQPIAAIKGSARMRKVLRRAVRDTPPGVPAELRIVYKGEVLKVDANRLERIRRRVHARGGQPNRLRVHAAEALLHALADLAEERAYDDGATFDRGALIAELADRMDFHRFVVVWWPILDPAEVLHWLGDEQRLRRAGKSVLDPDEITRLAASLTTESSGVSTADVALLDELRSLVGEPKRRRRAPGGHTRYTETAVVPSTRLPKHYEEYSHVVVDEAQDLSPMQWRMIGRRAKHASWTVVGDPMQSSLQETSEAVPAAEAAFGARSTRRHYMLRTNYRNSAEVFGLAARVLADHADPDQLPTAVRSTGIEPEVRELDPASIADAVRNAAHEMLGLVEGTVGVISAMDTVGEIGTILATCTDDRLKIVGTLDCKGLEYDGVVLVEPSELIHESPAGRHGLYVAMSRATHRLVVLTSTDDWLDPGGTA